MSENEAIVRPPSAPFPDRGVLFYATVNLKERANEHATEGRMVKS
jgi:hypothetical protein